MYLSNMYHNDQYKSTKNNYFIKIYIIMIKIKKTIEKNFDYAILLPERTKVLK